MPVVSADRPMKIGERSIRRVRSTVSASSGGLCAKPGAMIVGTRMGAASHITADAPIKSRSSALRTLDATRQASSSRSLAR